MENFNEAATLHNRQLVRVNTPKGEKDGLEDRISKLEKVNNTTNSIKIIFHKLCPLTFL